MIAYGNQNGNSGITGYEIGEDYIDVEFRNEKVYRYHKERIGNLNFFNMVAAACIGSGLNTHINKFVRRKHS